MYTLTAKETSKKLLWQSDRIDGPIDVEQSGEKLENHLTDDHF